MASMERNLILGSSPSPMARAKLAREVNVWTRKGYDVVCHNLPCPVQGAWAVKALNGWGGMFWGEEQGQLKRYCFDCRGVRIQQLLKEENQAGNNGTAEYQSLSPERWAKETAAQARFGLRLRRVRVAVEGDYPLRQALAAACRAAGGQVEHRWRPGIPAFRMDRGGFCLTARDERGAEVDSGQLLAVLTLIEMEQGSGSVALPPWSSQSARLVAAGFRGEVLELDQDGTQAADCYAAQPWLREAPSAAVRILFRMAASGQHLEDLVAKTPRFQTWKREAPLIWEREAVFARLREQGTLKAAGEGFRMHIGQTWLHVRPLGDWRVQVMAEGPDLELAEELCDLCVRRLEKRG